MEFLPIFYKTYEIWWDHYKDTMRYVEWLDKFHKGRLRYDSGQLNLEDNIFLFKDPVNLMAFLLRYSS